MKNTIIAIAFALVGTACLAQQNFKWDEKDSIAKTKDQIYSAAKMFIAKKWNSAQNVIQNDDKEAGSILVKGISVQEVPHQLNMFTYTYHYTVTFQMKDNKYRIIIDNVYCESAKPVGQAKYTIQKIQPFEGKYIKPKGDVWGTELPEDKAMGMMRKFKAELQSIVNDYEKYIKSPTTGNGDW